MVIHTMSCESKNNGYWWPFWNISTFTQARFCSAMESSRLVHKTPIFQWENHLCCFLSQSINQPTCLIFQVVHALLFQSHQPKTRCKKKTKKTGGETIWGWKMSRCPAWCIHPEDPIFHPQFSVNIFPCRFVPTGLVTLRLYPTLRLDVGDTSQLLTILQTL